MMVQDNSPPASLWWRKLIVPGAIGMVAGFVASAGLMSFLDTQAIGPFGLSESVAALIGIIYCVIALIVLVGTASPSLGVRILNVEDADEVREQHRMLLWSGVAMLLWGVALIALVLAGDGGPLPPAAGLAIGVAGLVGGTLLSVTVCRACDELMLLVNLEAGAFSYGLVLLVAGLWSMLAHLGYAAAPAPLDLLSLFYVLVLIASFAALGRRGMLALG